MSHNHSQNNAHGCCGEDDVTAVTDATLYTCPMHSEVHLKKPGNCPECGMNLIPVKKD